MTTLSTSTSAPPSNATSDPTTSQQRTLRIGTRASDLALAQVDIFTSLLFPPSPPSPSTPSPSPRTTPSLFTVHSNATQAGDIDKSTNLHTLAQSGKSLWTHDLSASLHRGEIDCIVHSLKDVPTKLEAGSRVMAVGRREWGGDVLVVREGRESEGEGGGNEKGGLEGLWREVYRKGGKGKKEVVIGTSSVRRSAMLARRWPGLVVRDVRGNVGTRLRKLDTPSSTSPPTPSTTISPPTSTPSASSPTPKSYAYDALILAGAGIVRLNLSHRISQWLGPQEGMFRAVGQGALGVEYREGDTWVEGLLRGVRVRRVEWECRAERSLLRTVEGGCSVPLGVEGSWEELGDDDDAEENGQRDGEGKGEKGEGKGVLVLQAMVVSLDGKESVYAECRRVVGSDDDAEEAGWEMAQELVAKGAGKILEKITLNRAMIQGMDNA